MDTSNNLDESQEIFKSQFQKIINYMILFMYVKILEMENQLVASRG
jgi:hypothetical protein